MSGELLTELEQLAGALDDQLAANGSDLVVYAVPGEQGSGQTRRLQLQAPALEWPLGTSSPNPLALAEWTLPATLFASGSSTGAVRQLYDDLVDVLIAIPDGWRCTAVAPAVLADTLGGSPIFTLTLER